MLDDDLRRRYFLRNVANPNSATVSNVINTSSFATRFARRRLDAASRIIQGAYRAHLAWQIIKKLREERAAQYIQRCYRGWKGRLAFLERMRLVWAAQLVQRNWRGHAGREQFLRRR